MSNERFIEMPEVVCKMADGIGAQPVRQMTVEGVSNLLRATVKAAPIDLGSAYIAMAEALAKLGTIRIVGDK